MSRKLTFPIIKALYEIGKRKKTKRIPTTKMNEVDYENCIKLLNK